MTYDLLEEIKAEYDLCINKPEKYQQKVDRISSLFSLSGKKRLKAEICPVYLFGKYRLTPFVIFGINSPIEDQEARRSWKHYQDLYLNFFLYFSNNRFESPYYTSLWHFVSGLVNSDDRREHQKKDKWKLFDTYLTNIELIPYHSEGISLPPELSRTQLCYLTSRFQNSLRFIVKFGPKLFIFNGNPWYVLLIKHNLIKGYEKVQITDRFNLYFFDLEEIPCVLFDKFFQRHFWGITDYDRKTTIPNLIRKRYQNLT